MALELKDGEYTRGGVFVGYNQENWVRDVPCKGCEGHGPRWNCNMWCNQHGQWNCPCDIQECGICCLEYDVSCLVTCDVCRDPVGVCYGCLNKLVDARPGNHVNRFNQKECIYQCPWCRSDIPTFIPQYACPPPLEDFIDGRYVTMFD